MYKNTKKNQIFIYRKIRKIHKDKYKKFNMLKYCIYDLIRKKVKEDTGVFEYKQKFIAKTLNVSEASVSNIVKYLIKIRLLEKNDLGLLPKDKYWNSFIQSVEKKGSFVIIDFNVKRKIAQHGYFLTLEQFAVLSIILSLQINRYRSISIKSISRFLLIDRKTVVQSLKKLKEINFIDEKRRIKEGIIAQYFSELKQQIFYNQKEIEEKTINKYKYDRL